MPLSPELRERLVAARVGFEPAPPPRETPRERLIREVHAYLNEGGDPNISTNYKRPPDADGNEYVMGQMLNRARNHLEPFDGDKGLTEEDWRGLEARRVSRYALGTGGRFLFEMQAFLDAGGDPEFIGYDTKAPSGYGVGRQLTDCRQGNPPFPIEDEEAFWATLKDWKIPREPRPYAARLFWRHARTYVEAGGDRVIILHNVTMMIPGLDEKPYRFGQVVRKIRSDEPPIWWTDDDWREWDEFGLARARRAWGYQDKLLAAVQERPGEKCAVYAQMTGLGERQVSQGLRELRKKGLVRNEGATVAARWYAIVAD